MDFQLSDESAMIQEMARNFALKEILPIAASHDESGNFPMKTVRKMGKLDLFGIEIDEEYGGSGLDTEAYVSAIIEISSACASHGVILSVINSLYCSGLEKYGTEDQKKKWLEPVASGEKIAAYALTEPQSGSDAGDMRASAVLSDDKSHYVINGSKSWITSGPVADFLILFAITDPQAEPKYRGVSAFLIDTMVEGFSRGKTEKKLGIRASATCEIHFANYKCPKESILGNEGEGFKIAMSILDSGRIGIASQAVGVARAAYEASVEYAKTRKAFGSPIGSFQQIQERLANMKMKLEAATLLTYKAAWAKTKAKKSKGRFTIEAAVAKLFASEAAQYITDEAIQIHGGMGYSRDLPIERYWRDARITRIYEGTSEIQRIVIARNETGLR